MSASPKIQPHISFDPSLPISEHVDEIVALIQRHRVVIVAGETGSGKTTQLPKICLKAGRTRIGHTQPRRIAARAVAERLAAELQVPLGDYVGYQVRFGQQTSLATRIKVMTDGIMLNEVTHDRLKRYDTIIIDEAHERSLTIDFLLGCVKKLLEERDDLKVIITSATIDTARFATHFDDAPIVEVSGRTYPVQVIYQPSPADDEQGDQADAIVEAARQLIAHGPGDILVFCPGERQIKDAVDALGRALPQCEILPLHSRLSAREQHAIFASHSSRRIIVATNIAETSLTVPGICYVIDTGTARISRYSSRTKVQRLPIESISQASANQRAGRCGRIGPGVCVRLYSEEDFEQRPQYTDPEIIRTNLASVILSMSKARLGRIDDFPFIDAPDCAQINDGLRVLKELGAVAESSTRDEIRLTRIGHRLADLPIDPRLARMIVEADRRHCLKDVLIVVSFLAIQDIRERPADAVEQAAAAHERFFTDAVLNEFDEPSSARQTHSDESVPLSYQPVSKRSHQRAGQGVAVPRHTPHTSKRLRTQAVKAPRVDPSGDFSAIIRMWRYLKACRKQMSGNQLRKRCRAEYLNYVRYREWQDLHSQLKRMAKKAGMTPDSSADSDQMLICVLAGLLSHVGVRQERPAKKNDRRAVRGPAIYRGTRGSQFSIQPGSALAKNPPDLVMAADLVETTRLWARGVAAIQGEWVEQVGKHLVKRSYSEPVWSSSSASVIAYEKVTMLGVTVIGDRRVGYGRIDPVVAREIFIRRALVEEQWRPIDTHARHDFVRHNRSVIEDAEQMAERTRGHGFLIDDRDVYRFYDERIPADVCSGATFDRWWKNYPDPHYLEFDIDHFVDDHLEHARENYPDRWDSLAIAYRFEPGHSEDGATVHIPVSVLNQFQANEFSWHVPGMRQELAVELIRTLPKPVRVNFVPVPDHARKALDWLSHHDPDHSRRFCDELGRALHATTGVAIEPDDWRPDAVPDHLRIGFNVAGRTSKDLATVQQVQSHKISQTITRAAPRVAQTTRWDFDDLQPQVTIRRAGVDVHGYPAVHDCVDGVDVILAETPRRQRTVHRAGIRRLLTLTNPDPTRWAVSHLSATDKLALASSPYRDLPALLGDARLKAVEQCARVDFDAVRTHTAYEELAVQVRQEQADQMLSVVRTAAQICLLQGQLTQLLDRVPHLSPEIDDQRGNLVFDGYIAFTRDPWFNRLPIYLQAMISRCQMSLTNPNRDAKLVEPVEQVQALFDQACDRLPADRSLPDELDDLGFWIEELRVQVFAQRLGTCIPVSAKRIRRAIENLPEDLWR